MTGGMSCLTGSPFCLRGGGSCLRESDAYDGMGVLPYGEGLFMTGSVSCLTG